jgi:NTE family protein
MRFHLKLNRVCLAIALGLCSALAIAQDRPNPRPRVGIALSGGGALGLAQIGVLKYFEEHRIPIDYIGGTSMGGLIGGFYATGLTPSELEAIVRDAKWDDLLSSDYQFHDAPIVEKQEWNIQSGTFTLRFGKRLTLPVGINSGQSLALLLSHSTQAYSNLESFDHLPTPFRCVATDLVTGAPAVLDRGSLPKALRATMALPGIFTPVNWEGKVLIDGGVTDNIPVDVVRQMGAEKVIAISLETPRLSAGQFTSLTTVLRQTASISVLQNERQSMAKADLVIHVHLQGVSGTDYERSGELIRQGYAAAQSMSHELEAYQISEPDWQTYITHRRELIRPTREQGQLVEVFSPQAKVQASAQHELYRKLGAHDFTVDKLEDVLAGVVAASGLPGAYYEWRSVVGKPEGFRVEFLDRQNAMVLLRPTLSLNISNGERTRTALNVGTTFIPLATYKSRVLGEVNLGSDPAIYGEYYHPFGGSPYFFAAGGTINRLHNSLYDGPKRQTFLQDGVAGWLYTGIGTWRYVQLRMGTQLGYDSYNHGVVLDGLTARSNAFYQPEFTLAFNNQDSGAVPTRGTRLDASTGYVLRDHSYPFIRSRISSIHPVTNRVSGFIRAQADSSFGKSLSFFDRFTLGGERNLEAYRFQEFHANTLLDGGAGIILRGPILKSLSTNLNFAVWHEAARMDLGLAGWQTHQSTTTALFFPSPVGALGIAVAFNENGKARFRLSVGNF